MDSLSSVLLNHFIVLLLFLSTISFYCPVNADERKVYIVYMGSLPEGEYSPTSHHSTILEEILESSTVSEALVRSYKRSFNGFAAKLTNAERQRLASRSEVVSIFPSRTLQLQTSRSWDFMGLLDSSKRNHSVESDTIIGVFDTGLWFDSPSFNDVGFYTHPKKWKGICNGGANFTCNNKVIGARFYSNNDNSAIDTDGHGSHTASIAAGNNVKDASFFGVGTGLVRGGVPSARIAVYKVCGNATCEESDVLSGFDDAISDGVDILSLSIGGTSATALTESSIAIGSFHALTKDILTVQAGGNSGPRRGSIVSVAPWLFSVAASNTDRRFVSRVVLGNKMEYLANSVNSFSLNGTEFPIVFGKNAGKKCSQLSTEYCREDCLDSELVKGKIVLCRSIDEGTLEASAKNAAAVIGTSPVLDYSFIVPFPAAHLSFENFDLVIAYYNSARDPKANIFKSEGLKVGYPPTVASFSARGPNTVIPDILKPDISAPGVDVLAAYSMVAPISIFFDMDTRRTGYYVESGTSMSCPHVAGVAAYVKTFHPDWSPAAIKSSIMTTAWPMKPTEKNDYEFAYGYGHVDPIKAINPGLVYDIAKEGYIKLLCDIGLNEDSIRIITGNKGNCSKESGKSGSSAKDFNYPSMTASLNTTGAFKIQFTRTVTNVGIASSIYISTITSSNIAIKVEVEPSTMSFESIGEKKTFNVTVTSTTNLNTMFSASLIWSDSVHQVRSPIVLYKLGI